MKFADNETAKKIVKDLYPDAKEVTFVEHGYDNLVVLIDEKYTVKFPRNEYAHLRNLYEKLILLNLASLKATSISKILGEGNNPPYIITSFVHGDHLSSDEIVHWPIDKQKGFAEQVVNFAFSMHSILSAKKAIDDQKKVGLNDFSFYEYALSNYNFPSPKQDQIAKNYYSRWKNLQYTTPQVVIHNDLQIMNLLFKDGELVGVIDFGDSMIGHPEQELRQMYRLNETILQSATDTYE